METNNHGRSAIEVHKMAFLANDKIVDYLHLRWFIKLLIHYNSLFIRYINNKLFLKTLITN